MRPLWVTWTLTMIVFLAAMVGGANASPVRSSLVTSISFVNAWGNETTPPEVPPPAAQTQMNLTVGSDYGPGREVIAMGTVCINGSVAPPIYFSDTGGSILTNLVNDQRIAASVTCTLQMAATSSAFASTMVKMNWTVPPLRIDWYANLIVHVYANVQTIGITNHTHAAVTAQLIIYNPPSFNGSWIFGMATDVSSCAPPGGNYPTFFTLPPIVASTVRIKENHAALQLCAQSGDTNSSVAQGFKQGLGWSAWTTGDTIMAVTGELIPVYFPNPSPYNPPTGNPQAIISAGMANLVFILGAGGMVGFVFLLGYDFFRKVWES